MSSLAQGALQVNQEQIKWIAGAVPVLGLGAASLILGFTLLPSRIAAQQADKVVPWFMTWGLIWTTTVVAVVLAALLVTIGLGKSAIGHVHGSAHAAAPCTDNPH